MVLTEAYVDVGNGAQSKLFLPHSARVMPVIASRREFFNGLPQGLFGPFSGKGLTLVVGILVAIALVAGLMFFAGPRDRTDQAQLPAQERTMTPPADQNRIPAIPPVPFWRRSEYLRTR